MRGLALLLTLALFGANALFGGRSSEEALRQFDQNRLHAYYARLRVPQGDLPKVDGFVVEERIPLPGFSYYLGQSLVGGSRISCVSRRSVVLWYGPGAVLVWQDGLWLPDRPGAHQRFAVTGSLR